MIELALANATYVFYRLAVSGPLVKFLNYKLNYYVAVFVMAQLSFIYDNFIFYNYFNASGFEWLDLFVADFLYTARVIVAWWIIKQIWNKIGNYWIAVFLGAELTFVVDYFIIGSVYS
jgi:hypothetical protein|tara:strand:- start:776 stop:1129 length:354 start_codon:yes stop_codon:yes gene_type:complete